MVLQNLSSSFYQKLVMVSSQLDYGSRLVLMVFELLTIGANNGSLVATLDVFKDFLVCQCLRISC